MNMCTRIAQSITTAGALSLGCSHADPVAAATTEGSTGSTTTATAPATTESSGSVQTASETTGAADTSSTTPSATTEASSSSSDGPPSCAPDETCRAPIDAPWEGPVLLRESPRPGSGSCSGEFAELEASVHAELVAPAATCTCACDPVGEPSCELTSEVWQAENNSCDAPWEMWDVGAACNPNVSAAAGTSVHAWPVRVEGVTCEPNFSEEVAPADFAREFLLCGRSGSTSTCLGDGICVPHPNDDEDAVCVWREGDFPCPEKWAQTRYLHYQAFIDERRCTECTCDDFYGTCSGITLLLFGTNACNEAPVAGITTGTCDQVGNQGATAARRSGVGVPEVDCSGEVQGGVSVGSAGPTSPVTVCCVD